MNCDTEDTFVVYFQNLLYSLYISYCKYLISRMRFMDTTSVFLVSISYSDLSKFVNVIIASQFDHCCILYISFVLCFIGKRLVSCSDGSCRIWYHGGRY